MWLTQQLGGSAGVKLTSGLVADAEKFSVQSDSKYERPEQLFPYGFSSAAEAGAQAVMLDRFCAGTPHVPDTGLRPGEVRLYSSGGAEIFLKADGRVLINGQTFQPKGVG